MRTLRAKQISTGNWFQRIDTGKKSEVIFKQEVSGQFNLPLSEILIVVGEMDQAKYDQLQMDMRDGTIPIIRAPVPPPPPDPRADMKAAAAAANSLPELRAVVQSILDRL